MLEDKRVGIEIYMIHERIDLMHYNYNADADIIVNAYADWDEIYQNKGQAPDNSVHIEFITNKHSGIKRMEISKWLNGRYLGHIRKYIKNNI